MFSSALYSAGGANDLLSGRDESTDGIRRHHASRMTDESALDDESVPASARKSALLLYLLAATQFLIFMDRFALYETWSQIRWSLDLDHREVVAFVLLIYVVQTAAAPLAGLAGDRLNRTLLMGWILIAWMGGSFASSKDWGFAAFLSARSLMAVAETTFAAVSPPLVAELYAKSEQRRPRLLLLFAAIPAGSGVGYVAGAFIAYWASSWRWAMRAPSFAALLVAIVWRRTTRGESEKAGVERGQDNDDEHSPLVTWAKDVGELVKIPSYVLCSVGMASVLFVLERFNVFAPAILKFKSDDPHAMRIRISFGLSVCLGSLASLAFGVRLVEMWRRRVKSRISHHHHVEYKADLALCALLLGAVIPLVYGTLSLLGSYLVIEWLLIAAVVFMLCVCFAVATDILMDIVPQTSRALATGFQALLALLIETTMFVAFTLLWPSATFAAAFSDIIVQLVAVLSAGSIALLFAVRFVERDWRVQADEVQLLGQQSMPKSNDYDRGYA